MIKATKNLREINQELERLMAEFSNSFSQFVSNMEKQTFLTPWYVHVHVWFALLLYYGQIYKNLNGLGLPKRTPKCWKGYPESFILCCLIHWTNFWLNSWVYKVWRLHLSGLVEQSVSVQINDVVLETFLSSAKSLHRCLRIKHQTFQTSHFILFTH